MTLKSKCAFDIAAKLPVEQPLTERELLILGLTVDYCGQLGNPCSCGCVAAALCDYPVGKDKTCDRILCNDTPCGYKIAPHIDYCHDHYKEWQTFKDAGGVKSVLENVVPFKEGRP